MNILGKEDSLKGLKWGHRNIFNDLREVQLSWEAFHSFPSKIETLEPRWILLILKCLHYSTLSHYPGAMAHLHFLENLMHLPTCIPLPLLVFLPKCPFPPSLLDQLSSCIWAQLFNGLLTTQRIKISLVLSSSSLFFSFLGYWSLKLFVSFFYWLSVLHQTVCSLQAGIMSVLFTSV